MSARMLVDGKPGSRIAADDRGLLYGDGLFETILFLKGAAPLWPRHMERLRHGCERLALPAPD
ncbi:MAG TPA: aminodeoxychorismate lyase, partial [Rhodanobacteraceae bacterium]|nr:aminodeoxychorismate lyase [Rhodanobacteraceae bacterium]